MVQRAEHPGPTEGTGNVVRVETVIVGAGPAGLSVAACLQRVGVPFVVLERGDRVSASWDRHYERLHLHTDKSRSELPYFPFPKRYPSIPHERSLSPTWSRTPGTSGCSLASARMSSPLVLGTD